VAQNTIIDNVGGSRPNLGVASEATLQALVEAVNRKGIGQQGQGSRIQETYNRAISQGTTEVGSFTKAVKSTTAAAVNFGKELAFGGDRVSNFSDAIFGASSSISTLTRFIERQVDTFRDLASVGASFNNSMFDMMAASANSSMNMDEFAQMVKINSGAFAGFGSSVTGGAKVFGEFSRRFRTGVGQQFFEMGFTIGDINDSLISFLDIETRRSSRNLRTDRQQQEAAAGYITSLDLLTKLTGKQRKEIENAMATQVQDAGIRSQLNRLQGKELENFRAGLAFLDTEMGPLGDGLKDLMDGVAQTDMGKALLNQLPGIGEFAKEMFEGGASMEEIVDQLGNNFGPQLDALSGQFSKQQLDQMRMQGGINGAIAEMLDNAHRLNKTKMLDVKTAMEEQKKREKLTSAFGKFEQTIQDIRKSIVDTFYELGESTGFFDAITGLVDAFSALTVPGTGGLKGIVPGLRSALGNTLTFFTDLIKRFTNWIKEGNLQTYIDALGEKFRNFGEYISGLTERIKTEGLWEVIKSEVIKGFTGLQDFWNGPTMTNLSNNISNWFKDLLFGKAVTTRDKQETVREGGLVKFITDGFSGLFETAKTALGNLIGLDNTAGADPYLHQVLQQIGLDTATGADSYLDQILQRIGLDTATGADSYLDQIKNKILDAFLGKEVMVGNDPDSGQMERQGGIFESIATGFSNLFNNSEVIASMTSAFQKLFDTVINGFVNFWESDSAKGMQDIIVNMFNEIYLRAIQALDQIPFVDMSGQLRSQSYTSQNRLSSGQEISAREAENIKEQIANDIASIQDSIDGPAWFFRSQEEIDQRTQTLEFLRQRQSEIDAMLAAMGQAELNSNAQGTNGFQDFGKKSYATLHGIEAVIPKNSPEGRLLEAFYATQGMTLSNNQMQSPQSTTVASADQSQIANKLDQLNTNMIKVAGLLEAGLGVQSKTMKSVKGIGMDYYRGIAR
jgi:hypothetical protein